MTDHGASEGATGDNEDWNDGGELRPNWAGVTASRPQFLTWGCIFRRPRARSGLVRAAPHLVADNRRGLRPRQRPAKLQERQAARPDRLDSVETQVT